MLSTLSVNFLLCALCVKSLNFNFTPICDNFTKWGDPENILPNYLWLSKLLLLKKKSLTIFCNAESYNSFSDITLLSACEQIKLQFHF